MCVCGSKAARLEDLSNSMCQVCVCGLCMFKLMSSPLPLKHLSVQTEDLSGPHGEVNLRRRHTGLTSLSSLPAQMLSIS